MAYADQDSSKVYVGNLSFQSDKDELADVFSKYGPLSDCIVITDRDTGRSRGFGFVTFENASDAQEAVRSVDGQELKGRIIKVNIARPRGGGGDGRGFSRGGGYGGNYGRY